MNIYLGQIWIENGGVRMPLEYKLVQAESEALAQAKFDDYAIKKIELMKTKLRRIKLVSSIVQSPI